MIAKSAKPITGLDVDGYLADVNLHSLPRVGASSASSLLLIINKEMLVAVSDRALVEYNIHSVCVQAQRSLPLFDVKLLLQLYVKGYAPLVAKLLMKLTH